MKAIIGLGNPEPEYSWTRHNIGKEILNLLVKLTLPESNWAIEKKLNSEIIKTNQLLLAKPLTYMNNSGEAIQKILNYYDIKPENLILVYDELDLIIESYKLNFNKGSKIHNGVISTNKFIEGEYWHLRIGVRDPEIEGSIQKTGRDPAKYVLSKIGDENREKIKKMTENFILKDLTEWLSKY